LNSYLHRNVKPLKFRSGQFDSILVQGSIEPDQPAWIDVEHNLITPVHFAQARYDSLKPCEHHEFFISMLVEGLHKAAKSYEIPLKEILGFIEDFRKGGYRNEWVHQTKLLRGTGLRATLLCSMDSERFQLTLKLERKGSTVFEKVILTEMPDETCFAHQFKDVVLKGRKILVRPKHWEVPGTPPLFVLDLKDVDQPGTIEKCWFQLPRKVSYVGMQFTLAALPVAGHERRRFDKAVMKLADAVDAWPFLDKRALMCARRPWKTDSETLAVVPDEAGRVPKCVTDAGYQFFADVHTAAQVLSVVELRSLTADEQCRLLVHYVEHGAYPEWFKDWRLGAQPGSAPEAQQA